MLFFSHTVENFLIIQNIKIYTGFLFIYKMIISICSKMIYNTVV